ncbi:MAG: alpha-amylase, partial [Treponema sp.]|nr:alpha-amylase [Treponema sp.]
MDSKWIVEKPNLFIQRQDCPFPQYSFTGENRSLDERVGVYLEDHYYDKTDCAVIFKRVDNYTGDVRYIYHGNDGTGLPWNDTAQIDFLNPSAREEVIQQIIKVAKNFPIIRFDAAMVLAKKHIRRLWYPEPGHGGDIATRSETRLSTSQFNDAIPNEFWREVVDRIAKEVPDTLLLAEAFWMMEGYFVRTLGMHRVYNSAFMNMLKKEENQKYRETIKNTLLFDRQVLKRFVNFMNNPDEETAVAQFGKGDKYFGVCTLMVTMPGLPMFGHGQIEGFEEKYGMEYAKAYWNESPDEYLLHRHEKVIFPLMKNRYLFAEVENFLFYDLWNNGSVNENVFAYSNEAFGKRTLVLYNNKYERSFGWINQSCEYVVKTEDGENDKTLVSKKVAEGLGLTYKDENFCILFEHLSSLWYIRKSSDIFDNGLFVALNGFEVQVYMDIHEVQDTEEKKWSILCESLQGKGCENLEVAWEEIKYAKLYQSLSSFLGEFLPLIYNLINENYSKKMSKSTFCLQLEKIFEIVKDSAINFYTVGIEEAKNENVKMHSSQKQFLEFKKLAHLILENFYEIDFDVNEKKDCTVYESLLEKSFAKEFIQTYFLQEESSVFAFLCYASLWNFSSTALAEKFSFDRKIFENVKLFLSEEINIKIDFDFKNLLKKIFLFAPMTKKIATKKIKIDTGHDVICFLLDNKNSSFFCGKNLYDGVKWYKKEMFESSVAIFFMLAILHSSLEVEQQIIKLFRDIADANIRASYKCELLINQFAKQNRSKASSKKGASHIPSIRQSNGKQKEMTMAVTTAKKTTATKKPAAKKATTVKKPAAKKATTAKKPAAKKPAAKKA